MLLDNGNASRSVLIVRCEKRRTPVEYASEIVDEPADTVRTLVLRVPSRYVKVYGATRQVASPNIEDRVDVFRPIYLGDYRQTIRRQSSHLSHQPIVATTRR